LGILRSIKGDEEGAVEAYDRALDLYPFNHAAACEKAKSLTHLGRKVEAATAARSCEYLTHEVYVITPRRAM
jgi:hypothetical protein